MDIKKVSDYKVVEAQSATNLGRMIRDELKNGWQLQGNMLLTNDIPQKYIQVLVR